MQADYKLYIPSGNPTILVKGIPDVEEKRKINDYLLDKHQKVEQVGFISEKSYELEMAGGEFCGNATRCAIYHYLNGKDGNLTIKVNDNYLEGGIINGKVWVNMPVLDMPTEKVVTRFDAYTIVKLDGITHVVTELDATGFDEDHAKEMAFDIMKKFELLGEPACGVMFIKYNGDSITLVPVVYVRDVNTLFYETACGSGTTAVGIYHFLKQSSNCSIPVIQPSGKSIDVSVYGDECKITRATISGEVTSYEY